jgi:hypothetical protein
MPELLMIVPDFILHLYSKEGVKSSNMAYLGPGSAITVPVDTLRPCVETR